MKEFEYVRLLQEVGREDLSAAGGKGANLGEMLKAGLPVPEGFVLLVNSYRRFVKENGLEKDIENLLNGIEAGHGEDIREAAEKIRGLFAGGEIPGEIKKEIAEIYATLGEPPAAVRSSATAEDLPGASFAGQYTTFLNVQGKEELYAAIKKCWASLWNERAVSYRAKQNIGGKGLGHGVVVQKLVSSEKSGILFTANPVNGRRDQISLNSSWGLGEAIVGGEVDPDQWVISKKDGTTVSEYIAAKKVMTVRIDEGIELVDVEQEKQEEATLNEGERKELFGLALKVENYFGYPQDIEWAWESGKFYLVQTRPITALFPMPKPEDKGEKLHVYINMSLYSQGMHEPLTPLAVDLFRILYLDVGRRMNRRYYREPDLWNKRAGGRLFFDITELIKLKKVQENLKGNKMIDKDPVTIQILLQLLERDKDALAKPKTPLSKSIKGFFSKINPWIIKYMLVSAPKILYGTLFPQKSLTKALKYGERIIAETEERSRKLQTRKEKLAFIKESCADNILLYPFQIMFYGIVSLNYLDKARKILSKHEVTTSEVDKVEKAVPNCVTTEMGMELLQLAKKLAQAGEEPYPGHPDIKHFLKKHGHRSAEEIDIGVSRWKEVPGYVVSLIRSYMENNIYQEGIDKFHRDMEEAERAIESVTAQLREKGAHGDAGKVEKLLRGHRDLYGIREYPKFVLLKAIELFRDMLKEIGSELQSEGRLNHKEDIFMVSFQDIESGENLQEKVGKNREEYLREMQRTSVPRIMTSTGETIYSALDDERDGGLRGVPVSPGSCEGTIKVLKHPQEADRLEQGDILVTASTNPAWTPLFLIIGGLIMETGGPISHGSVVAREYGIPAVVGVKDATGRFADGQRVRINGESGRIEILSDNAV